MLLAKIQLPYALAIVVTSALMIWQSIDTGRGGAEFRGQALFWAASVSAGWLQKIVIARGVRVTLGAARHPGWVLLLASALIGAMPLTFQVRWMMDTIVAPQAGLPELWVTDLNVTLICTVFGLIQYMLIEDRPILDTMRREPETRASIGVDLAADSARTDGSSLPEDTSIDPVVGLLGRRPDIPVGRSFEKSLREAAWY